MHNFETDEFMKNLDMYQSNVRYMDVYGRGNALNFQETNQDLSLSRKLTELRYGKLM